MKNLFFLSIVLYSCTSTYSDKTNEKRPNILFIMSDDHTSQAWGIYNDLLADYVKNDNIVKLAKEGMVLDNVFCTNSICTPSRASILTGQYSHQNGIYTLTEGLSPDSNNIAKTLQSDGYETAIIGKWHLKKQPTGFDYFNVLPGQGRYHDPILKTKENWENGNKGGVVYKGFSADVIGDLSVQWLSNRTKEKPFFLMTHFKATHEPFDYPKRYSTLNKGVEIPIPTSLYDFGSTTNGRTFDGQQLWRLKERYLAATRKIQAGENSRYPNLPFTVAGLDSLQTRYATYQKFIKDFIRSGAAIDDNIGKLLDYLEENNLVENTIVIYTSDQGYFLGEHGFFDKRMIYEESMRMPFVIRYPTEIPANTRNNDIILNIDFPSLFADYASITPPSFLNGRSFRDNLKGKTPSDWRTAMYYRYWLHQQQRPAHFGIRNDRYKLAFFYGQPLGLPGTHSEISVPAWEFYDLKKDPQENHNAYDNPAYQMTIRTMKKELVELRQQWGDTDEQHPIMGDILKELDR